MRTQSQIGPVVLACAFCLGVASNRLVIRWTQEVLNTIRKWSNGRNYAPNKLQCLLVGEPQPPAINVLELSPTSTDDSHAPPGCLCGGTSIRIAGQLDNGADGFLPFSDFAACSLLDIQPEDRVMCSLYADLKCCAALFLKADRKGMLQQLRSRSLGEVLKRHARLASILTTLCPSHLPATTSCIVDSCPRSYMQSCSLNMQGSIHLLVLQLEVLLYRYLTSHWDRIQELVAVNEEDCDLCQQYLTTMAEVEGSISGSGGSMKSVGSISSLDTITSFGMNGSSSRYKSGSRDAAEDSRARKNWRRAYRAALKQVETKRLAFVRKVRSLHEVFKSLRASSQQDQRVEGRAPVLLFLGGGMAAGKSTVRELIGQSEFWSTVGKDAVVVEADAIKYQDVLYQKLSSRKEFSHDLSIDAYVHEYATKAAESLLVAAINDQRDVVFDGTHVWPAFIQQTIEMVRDHENDYTMGPGYVEHADGTVTEDYWVRVKDGESRECEALPPCCSERHFSGRKVPYRIELVGVTCDPGLAVVRGVWRRLRTGRSVPISSQLRSHRMFAENFEHFASMVDSATLYHTGGQLSTFNKSWKEMQPKVIAHRSSATLGEMLVNPPAYQEFKRCLEINDKAQRLDEIFPAAEATTCPLQLHPELKKARMKTLKALLVSDYKHQAEEEDQTDFDQISQGSDLEVIDSLDASPLLVPSRSLKERLGSALVSDTSCFQEVPETLIQTITTPLQALSLSKQLSRRLSAMTPLGSERTDNGYRSAPGTPRVESGL